MAKHRLLTATSAFCLLLAGCHHQQVHTITLSLGAVPYAKSGQTLYFNALGLDPSVSYTVSFQNGSPCETDPGYGTSANPPYCTVKQMNASTLFMYNLVQQSSSNTSGSASPSAKPNIPFNVVPCRICIIVAGDSDNPTAPSTSSGPQGTGLQSSSLLTPSTYGPDNPANVVLCPKPGDVADPISVEIGTPISWWLSNASQWNVTFPEAQNPCTGTNSFPQYSTCVVAQNAAPGTTYQYTVSSSSCNGNASLTVVANDQNGNRKSGSIANH